MKDIECAYLAGFIDADGTITINSEKLKVNHKRSNTMSNPEGDIRTTRTEKSGETIKKLKRQVERLEERVVILEGHKCKCDSKDELGNDLLARIFSKW
jgi:hypothetical protein